MPTRGDVPSRAPYYDDGGVGLGVDDSNKSMLIKSGVRTLSRLAITVSGSGATPSTQVRPTMSPNRWEEGSRPRKLPDLLRWVNFVHPN